MWEITGAEFTNQGVHTADGISIRFPRVTKIRDDKDWETATSLRELRALLKKSSDSIDFSLLLGSKAEKQGKKEKKIAKLGNNCVKPAKDAVTDPTIGNEITSDDEIMDHDVNKKKRKVTLRSCGEFEDNKSGRKHNKPSFYAFFNKDVSYVYE